MKNIDCPEGASNVESCAWKKRSGAIRDLPAFGVEECEDCMLVSHEKDLREFVDYESGSMHNWASGYGGTLANPTEDISRRVNEILNISKNFKIKSILDFGSGSGEMITALSEYFEVEGLEPEEQAREKCVEQGLHVHASTEEVKNAEKHFDLVTLFHVVEHFYKPDTELTRIYNLLNPGGLLIIETPNSQDALLTKYKSLGFKDFTYWTHHPMLHSNKSLGSLVTRNKFDLIKNSGVQRYGLENHLYWLANDKPGGHITWEGMFSETTNLNYGTDLVSQGIADTIWLVAQKPLP
jgi:2-polyprenyl-3-methyl-5-hydroxy-6-metoxy-1,4-benzoquinol methylase